MKAQIIQIGNSQGVRLPKTLLQDSGVKGEVELELHPEGILIRSITKPRSDWDDKFKAAAEYDEDLSLAADAGSKFADKEWQW